MKYYITYRLEDDPETEINIAGPYSDYEYIHKAMEIVSTDFIFDLDIVNEVAMEIYRAFTESDIFSVPENVIETVGFETWDDDLPF